MVYIRYVMTTPTTFPLSLPESNLLLDSLRKEAARLRARATRLRVTRCHVAAKAVLDAERLETLAARVAEWQGANFTPEAK